MKFNETIALGYIRISKFTNRRFILSENDPFIKYRAYVEGESFWEDLRSGDTYAKSCQKDYNKAKSAVKKNSMNYPIQGSSAELSKLAGIFFYRWIVQNDYRNIVKIVNMVHDEFVIEAPEDLMPIASAALEDCMVKAGGIYCKTIPLSVESAIDDFWVH